MANQKDSSKSTSTIGLSAYEAAKMNGYQGTEQQWLSSLMGTPRMTLYQSVMNSPFFRK